MDHCSHQYDGGSPILRATRGARCFVSGERYAVLFYEWGHECDRVYLDVDAFYGGYAYRFGDCCDSKLEQQL